MSKSRLIPIWQGDPFKIKVQDPSDNASPDAKVPKYQVQQVLGSGSFGQVSHITDQSGQSFALKKQVFKGDEALRDKEYFKREVENLGTLDHINVMKIYEVYDCGKEAYMITELCQGGTLANMHNAYRNHVPQYVLAKVVAQVLEGLKFLHANNICHRDLKPENIMFTSENQILVKIIDFGFTK